MTVDVVAIGISFDRWAELLQLIRQSFAYMDALIDPPSSALALTVESLEQKAGDEIGFIALDGERLVGCIFCRPEPPHCLYIGKLAVFPENQGKGIGKRLMSRAEDLARSLGYTELRLETRIELTGNHQRFAAMGFRQTAEGRHSGFDHTTFVEMRKRVPWA
ncbi:GNAT family N-acetyltransferase [Pseudomonas sp. R2.Fl]|nr:GNAT family N-acetyltransferase [Pseudomonas sp. R2.Fl]